MPGRTDADIDGKKDRRRSPRFSCGGHAKIVRLPSDGIFLPGKIIDLSLGGCYVDTTLPIDCGVRAEIVVHVNAASFRAIGEVKAMRGRSGASMEFVHLSSGGKDMLADLIAELARLQAVMNKLKSARREIDAESFREELEDGKLQAMTLSDQFPFRGTILSAGTSKPDLATSAEIIPSKKDTIVDAQPLVITVDLFG
ncbi:MAG: PilZ domain-containing protein [Terriglobales bacterium]